MALTIQQKSALDFVLAGHSCYIGGQAGVGKTYLINEIYSSSCRNGKKVALTCTTGIACSQFSKLDAVTIHKWSGIGDGRFSGDKLTTLLSHDEKYANSRDQILSTDIIIIDEISMLSMAVFDKLEVVCRLKNGDLKFGGIQVVLVGDFFQLSPVCNARYGDMGDFCFLSNNFPQHYIYLDQVVRQKNVKLIKFIQDLFLGNMNSDIGNYAKFLSRPIAGEALAVKLFANNVFVDMYNRDCILKIPGQLYVFEALDSGSPRALDSLVVQKTIWLKVDSHVMLLRNLTDTLVNGLRGTVLKIGDEKVTVHFPTIGQVAEHSRIPFTVFDPASNRNVAERQQLPLKLAYALTIHKSQGMTLPQVVVDCRNIFAPGQLAVAVGRVQSEDGLRIVNFNESAVIKQPAVLQEFVTQQTEPAIYDCSCCFKEMLSSPSVEFQTDPYLSDVPDSEWDVEFDVDEDMPDIDFDILISNISQSLVGGIQLPEDDDDGSGGRSLLADVTEWRLPTKVCDEMP